MKKQIILIITLIALVGITALVLLLVNHMEQEQAAERLQAEQEKILFDFNANDIYRIQIQTKDGDYTAQLDDNNQWVLEDEVDFEINTYYLNAVTSQLGSLHANSVVAKLEEVNLADYELDDPITITLHAEDQVYTLHTGKLSSTGEFYYVTVDGRDSVFSVSANYADYIHPSKDSLKSIYLLRSKDAPVSEISLQRDGALIYRLQLQDMIWHMTDPLETTDMLDNSHISSLLTDINQMVVDRFGEEHVTKKDYASYGFDKPAYTFSFTQSDGTVTTLDALEYDTAATSFVTLLCEETGQVFYMESTYTDFLQQTADSFFLKTIYDLNAADAAAVSITWAAREDAQILIDEQHDSYVLNGERLEADRVEAIAALENFYGKLQILRYDTMQLTETPDPAAEPFAVIAYTATDGTETEIRLLDRDSDSCWVLLNGEYTGFTLSKTTFTARNGVYDLYDTLLDAVHGA